MDEKFKVRCKIYSNLSILKNYYYKYGSKTIYNIYLYKSLLNVSLIVEIVQHATCGEI